MTLPIGTTSLGETGERESSLLPHVCLSDLDLLTDLGSRLSQLCPRRRLHKPHPGILLVCDEDRWVLVATTTLWSVAEATFQPWLALREERPIAFILVGTLETAEPTGLRERAVLGLLRTDASDAELLLALENAFDWLRGKQVEDHRSESVNGYEHEFGSLAEIARALTTERDIDRLLGLILEKSRLVTGADAGSLYVVEAAEPSAELRKLHFKLSQNDSVEFDWREFTMPIDKRSMAGCVALDRQTIRLDDVYQLDESAPFGFDRSFDERISYRTKSMICTPLVTNRGDVIGVLQLINKKRVPHARLLSVADVERYVVPFDPRSEQLLTAVASQAGIALENALLYEEIRGLFDGFVRASVDAIESRDPTTSGHSRRVASYTVQLARAVERCSAGKYAKVIWCDEDLRELEYASLLHDFGKIGVRESVLVKAKKLHGFELERIRHRFDFIIKSLEADTWAKRCRLVEAGADAVQLLQLDTDYRERVDLLEQAWSVIEQANEPTVLAAGDFSQLNDLGELMYDSLDGQRRPWLAADEILSLSVKRGSLTSSEFDEIRGHVSHTYRFLSRIPWGRTFARVPLIAGAHHERLDGTGYPNQLNASQIPLQSKMMSIADIFDALTAHDRPYKRAVPVERALDILGLEVKDGHLDGELVQLFIDARAWDPP